MFSLVLLQGGLGSYSQGRCWTSYIVHPSPCDGGSRRTCERQVSDGGGRGGGHDDDDNNYDDDDHHHHDGFADCDNVQF